MKALFSFLAVMPLFFLGTASAQWKDIPGEIGIYWSTSPDSCATCATMNSGYIEAYVILDNPKPTLSMYEFALVNADGSKFNPPPGIAIHEYGPILPTDAIDLSPEFYTYTVVVPYWPGEPGRTVLLRIPMYVTSPVKWCFGVAPISGSSLLDQMSFVADSWNPVPEPMLPNNGPNAPDYGMACLNDPDCPAGSSVIDKNKWENLKGKY